MRRPEEQVGPKDDRKYWGSYVGFVRDTNDPERRGRVRYHEPEVAGDEDNTDTWLDWALPKMPLAGFDTGALLVPPSPEEQSREDQDGDRESPIRRVAYWIEFRHGDPRFPIYTGGFWYGEGDIPNYTPPISEISNNGDESFLPPNGSAATRLLDFNSDGDLAESEPASEPRPSNEALYPRNRFYKSPSGHIIEADDTPNRERVKVYHRGGTYWEMTPDGSLITKVVGKRYTYVSDDDLRHVVGTCKEVLDRDYHIQVRGNTTEVYLQARRILEESEVTQISKANVSRQINGTYTLNVASLLLESLADANIAAAGTMSIAGLSTTVLGATKAEIISPTGVTLVGSSSPVAAIEPIMGGLTFNAGLATFNGTWGGLAATLATATAAYAATRPPPPAPEGVWLAAIATYLSGLAVAIPIWTAAAAASNTIHRVTPL